MLTMFARAIRVSCVRRTAIIDVEGHEGHVLAGAERLFPLVGLGREHVKRLPDYGGRSIVDFMHKFNMTPYNLMTGKPLHEDDWLKWPFTVLWKKHTST
nr:hypothetical protein BaRGS_033866 [Batillaria attramentaria]